MILYLSNPFIVNLAAAAATKVLNANPNRKSVIFTNPNNAADVVVWIDNTLNVTRGIYIPPKDRPVVIDGEVYGDIVKANWWGFSNALGTITLPVIEVLSYSQTEQEPNNVPIKSSPGNSGSSRHCYLTSQRKPDRVTLTPVSCSELFRRLRQTGSIK